MGPSNNRNPDLCAEGPGSMTELEGPWEGPDSLSSLEVDRTRFLDAQASLSTTPVRLSVREDP